MQDAGGRDNALEFRPSPPHPLSCILLPICWILRVMPPIEVVLTAPACAHPLSSYALGGELRSLGGKYESHVSRACARVVGLRRLPDDGFEGWPALRR